MATVTLARLSRKRSIGPALSAGNEASATPSIRAKKMTASMSPSAAALTGLRGTIFTSSSIESAFSDRPMAPSASPRYVASSRSLTAGSSPLPGRSTFIENRPIAVDSAVSERKLRIVTRPMRPSLRRLPSPAMPSDSVDRISGITTMISADSHILPIGSVTIATSRCVPGPPPVSRLVVTPTAAPATRPIRMRVCSGIGAGR